MVIAACGSAHEPPRAPVVATAPPPPPAVPIDAAPPPDAAAPDAPPPDAPPAFFVAPKPDYIETTEPTADWQKRCTTRLYAARDEVAKDYPAFAKGTVALTKKPRGVTFVADVDDAEHRRFFDKPARFAVEIHDEKFDEAGYLMPVVDSPDDQASLGWARWTKSREGSLEVEIVKKNIAKVFATAFDAAIRDCLR